MKYLIKQMDWDLIENFKDRSSKEFVLTDFDFELVA
jgi:hypothetical protein